MTAFDLIKQNALNYSLIPIPIKELLFMEVTPCDFFVINKGEYELALQQTTVITRETLKNLIANGNLVVYIRESDRSRIISHHQNNLQKISRSLSLGNPNSNAKKMMNLLTLNLEYLYLDPNNDETLNLQFQNLTNLASFLYNNLKMHTSFYNDYLSQNHHFVYAQPLISSLFVIGILKQTNYFSKRESEMLFISSSLKDIGMSVIPIEKYEKKELSLEDKILFQSHPSYSVQILKGRVPLSSRYLHIIENHHSFSLLGNNKTNFLKEQKSGNTSDISGAELMIITAMDVVAAMITGRPYTPPTKLYDALELVKGLIAENYPQEFKLIVRYFKNFFFSN